MDIEDEEEIENQANQNHSGLLYQLLSLVCIGRGQKIITPLATIFGLGGAIAFFSVNGTSYQLDLLQQYSVLCTVMSPAAFVSASMPLDSDSISFAAVRSLQLTAGERRDFNIASDLLATGISSLLLLLGGSPIDTNIVFYATFGGFAGTFLGMYFIVSYIGAEVVETVFASAITGLTISIALGRVVTRTTTVPMVRNVTRTIVVDILMFGFWGGIISSFSGTGKKRDFDDSLSHNGYFLSI